MSGCGGGNPDDDATLRAVNATSDVESIDLRFNDWLFAGAIGRGAMVSAYARRSLWSVGPAGWLEVSRAGSTSALLEATHSLPKGDTASVVVMGSLGAGLKLRVVDEDAQRPGSQAVRLRLLHAWPAVGALDVYVTSSGQTLAGRAPDGTVGVYEDLSAFGNPLPGSRLRITPRGEPDRILFDNPSTGFAGDQVVTLVLAPAQGPSRAAVAVLPSNGAGYVLINHAITGA